MVDFTLITVIFVILVLVTITAILLIAIKIIKPHEQGLLIILGNHRRKLNPGINMVPPLISRVVRIYMRTQKIELPKQKIMTKDNKKTNVEAIIHIKVTNPENAYFEVQDYKDASVHLGQTILWTLFEDMNYNEISRQQSELYAVIRKTMDDATNIWGVKVESVRILLS
jgi:regulator of protease activity HflC (stomatin/prohibitin superfamily)